MIAYSSLQIKGVIHPKDWPTPNLHTGIAFKTLKKHFTSYNYFDYMDAWQNIFCIQNPTHTHSWLVYFDQSRIKTTTRFPNWFLKWWQHRGISEEILSPEVFQVYQYFKTNFKPAQHEAYIPPLMYFCISFFIPWVYQWFFDFQYALGTNLHSIVKRHKIKWWGSFKNTTTEIVPSFGAQKAQCQALLAASKNPEEFKLICQQMYNQLTSSEKDKLNQESSSSKESSKWSSSKKMVKKKSSRRKSKKQSSSDTESTASETSSSEDPASSCNSNEDDCYGVLSAIRIKSKTDKVKKEKKKKEKVKKKGKEKKKQDTSSSESD
ncbi:hypothetical protein MANES_14G163216v8 [Manihot esculenta]|uniref:Uncharacterized protein n=1 Tax=Manihot esculenta TaxID=3983 RepID=A0ACB7GIS6_MANES|nr:hypothetical protein MANES_14G163216v8 [Manihot esculenta]